MARPVVMCWSGGKDSALALHELRRGGQYEAAALLTTVTAGYDRISMHGVRRSLLAAQADALGLPLREVVIPPQASNADYEARMAEALGEFRAAGLETVVFGDIFLADLRQYRERQLAALGMTPLFPLWERDTRQLVAEFLALGFRAMTCCVDAGRLDRTFVGQEIDAAFVQRLPAEVDPCGENGEYHSFVFAGPPFRQPIPIRTGEIVRRDSFFYCDLVSEGAENKT